MKHPAPSCAPIRAVRPLLFALSALCATLVCAANAIPDEHRTGGFAAGPQAFSFRLFTVFEAIEKAAQTGARVIEFSGKQKLMPGRPDVVFNHDSPSDVIASVQAKLRQHGVRAVNYGVVPIPAEEVGARKVFDFATCTRPIPGDGCGTGSGR